MNMNRTIHFLSTSRTAVILLLATLLTATTAQTAGAQPSGNWADYKATETLPQSDDGETIYISTAEQLALYAYNVNYDVKNSKGYYCARTVELQADIDLSAHYWTPIGNRSGFYFNGKFNGNGHVITGMNVNNDCGSNVYGFVGYFRDQSNNLSHIDNLIFRNCQVTGSVANNALGGVAIVAGSMSSNQSAVTNCLVLDCLVTETDKVNDYNSHGAIIGCANGFSATNNYYYNMSGEYGGGMTNYSGTTSVTADDNGARLAYAVTLPDGVTATATTGIAYDSKFYTTGGTTVTLSHEDRDDYIFNGYTSNDVTITNGTFTMPDADVTITATWTKKVQTGLISGTVTIPDGASITLSDATITGGIICEGSATITLVGTNSVSSSAYSKAGIQIGGSGATLTIKGDGSLTATGGSQAAGIGLGRTWDDNATGGSIVIEGGTVTASGDNGIGTGRVGNSKTATVGDIIIKGGTVNARLGNGYIYNGSSVTIGAIKIYDTIDKVDASAITESVTYMHVENETETDVTSTASTYFTIIEDGDRRIIEKKDDTDYSITIADGIEHGSIACAATTAKYGDKVTITATPDFGCRLSRLVVKDAQNNDVASTGNSFFMPKGNVTVSAVFEQGTHGTTEFKLMYSTGPMPEDEVYETIYDGVTTVNLQQGQSYQILEYDEYDDYREFLLDNDTYDATIPYSGGTGTFSEYENGTNFNLNDESGFYDITMTDVGNGKWSVSILKTVAVMDAVPDQTYTGSEITPEPLVLAGSLSLTKGTDYEYSYTNNTNVGTATVTVTFKGNYASIGSVAKTFTIVKATPTITAPTPVEDLVYSGSAQALVTAGTTDFGTLIYSTDGENYSADIPTATDAGTYTVYYKVVGSDNWNAVDAQTVSVTITYYDASLADNGDNADAISNIITNYGSKADVTLQGRTLTKSGDWNTLCLPFDVTTLDGTPLEGATIKTLDAANSNLAADGTLTLKFTAATSIEAGKPYIVKWETAGENISNPVFEGVTITATAPTAVPFTNYATTGDCQFVGQFSPFTIDASNLNEIILMGSGSTLGYSKAARTLKSMRAHFYVPAKNGAGARAFVLDFGDGETTGVVNEELRMKNEESATATGWYTIDGRKLNGKPGEKGVYILNGRKIVIR